MKKSIKAITLSFCLSTFAFAAYALCTVSVTYQWDDGYGRRHYTTATSTANTCSGAEFMATEAAGAYAGNHYLQ